MFDPTGNSIVLVALPTGGSVTMVTEYSISIKYASYN